MGAAAGLAAAFNSPIAAVIFVIEEVIGTWSAGILGAVVLAAVSSVVVTRFFLGAEPMFRVPTYTLTHPVELLGYAVLGLVGGLASVIFARLLGYLRAQTKGPSALDLLLATGRGGTDHRRDRLEVSPGHGRRL